MSVATKKPMSSVRARMAYDHARDFDFMTDEQIAERVAAAHRPDANGLSEWDRLLLAAEHERTS